MILGKSHKGPTVRKAPIVRMPTVVPIAKSESLTKPLPKAVSDREIKNDKVERARSQAG
jgi:hypothetical protein